MKPAHQRLSGRKCFRDLIITVETRHFLSQISCLLQILAERRNNHFICLCVIKQIKLIENSQHFIRRQIKSQHSVDCVRLKSDQAALDRMRIHIYSSADNSTGTELLDQRAGSFHCRFSVLRIQTLLKHGGSICAQADLV